MASTIFTKGQSTDRSPLFTRSNYTFWSTRISIYMQANDFEIWNSTQIQYVQPTPDYSMWTDVQKIVACNNSKAMKILFCALDNNEFNRDMVCTTARDIWTTLKTHENNPKSLFNNQFSNFKMNYKSISNMYSTF